LRYKISIREKLKKLDDYKRKPTNTLCLKGYAGYPRLEIYDNNSMLVLNRISRADTRVDLEVKYFSKSRG
jgi:hypothetical protein